MPDFNWFGGATNLAENQEVTTQSGFTRFGNALCLMLCGPFVIMIAMFVCGWNEKRAVCGAKAIIAGKDVVKEVGCDSISSGNDQELVMFSCPYTANTAENDQHSTPFSPGGAFSGTTFDGLGLKVMTEMKQCVETVNSQTKKNAGGGGGTTTVKTYTYSVQWKSELVNSGAFHKDPSANCGPFGNPTSWPAGTPAGGSKVATRASIGKFVVPSTFLTSVPLDQPLTATTTPSGWTSSGGWYEHGGGGQYDIGKVRTKFMVHDSEETFTVLGEQKGDDIGRWTAPSDWLCSGFTLGEMQVGKKSKDVLFKSMEETNTGVTYFLRFLSLLIFWCGFAMLCAPLPIIADCIPCVGPCLGDMIEAIICCVTCPPACACCMLVGGIVWIAMRPMLAIPLMIGSCAIAVGFVVFKMKADENRKNKVGDSSGGGGAQADPEKADAPPPAVVGGGEAPPPAQPQVEYKGPVPKDIAEGFLQAAKEEFVDNAGPKVGDFFGAHGEHEAVLAPFEERCRNGEIDKVRQEWGL